MGFILLVSRAKERSGWCPGTLSSSWEIGVGEDIDPLGCEMVLVDVVMREQQGLGGNAEVRAEGRCSGAGSLESWQVVGTSVPLELEEGDGFHQIQGGYF